MEEKPTFIEYIKAERSRFTTAINEQKWNTKLRCSAEDLLIAYDQMTELIKKQSDGDLQRLGKKLNITGGLKTKIMNDKCNYKQTGNKLPYPRVEWVCECGFKLALMNGYNPNYKSYDYGKLVKPTGKCMKCGKSINAI